MTINCTNIHCGTAKVIYFSCCSEISFSGSSASLLASSVLPHNYISGLLSHPELSNLRTVYTSSLVVFSTIPPGTLMFHPHLPFDSSIFSSCLPCCPLHWKTAVQLSINNRKKLPLPPSRRTENPAVPHSMLALVIFYSSMLSHFSTRCCSLWSINFSEQGI